MSQPRAGTRAAELRKQLLRISRTRQEDFQVTLSRYGVERLLYRLSRSRSVDLFILKGAILVGTWAAIPHRATRDVDFLGLGEAAPERLVAAFRELAGADGGDDAIVFDPESVRAEGIREDDRYGGVRLRMTANFGGAVVPVQVDIGFGDAVEPAAEWMDFPTLLELPAPRIRAYTRYSVVSEKLEAIVALGMLNSRMKDFCDIWCCLASSNSTGQSWRRRSEQRSIGGGLRYRLMFHRRWARSSSETLPSRVSGGHSLRGGSSGTAMWRWRKPSWEFAHSLGL